MMELKNYVSNLRFLCPDGGYWSKLKFNKPFKKEELHPISNEVDKIVLAIREEGNPVKVDQTPLTIRTKEIENDLKAPLVVPDKTGKPDIVTIQAKDYWNESKGDVFSDKYKKLNYPIRVGDKHRERALRFMDTLTKLLCYRGHTKKGCATLMKYVNHKVASEINILLPKLR